MYRKGTVLELQFSPGRLNDGAGDPFWIDLSAEEAARLLDVLQARLQPGKPDTEPPAVFALDGTTPAAADPSGGAGAPDGPDAADGFQQWICLICGWIYDEAAGLPEEGIAPGTRWQDVPADWRCPLCDVGKEDFAMVPF